MTHYMCKYCNEDLDEHTQAELEACNLRNNLAVVKEVE
tara:strand:- start:64 stop:177 length:114 start_codon:yes stop_codon:yes gene_type:complete